MNTCSSVFMFLQPFGSLPLGVSNGQVHLAGNGTDWNTYIHRDGKLKDGQAVRFSFQANTTAALANLMVYSGTWGTSDYRRWSLKLESGYLKLETYTGSTPGIVSLMALKANTWYEGVLSIDGTLPVNSSESYNPRFRVAVWERDNPNVWAQNRTQFATGWNGKEWYFFAQVKSGTMDIDHEQEYDEGAVGQRTKMVDGSGSAEWVYTSRGQVQSEKKTITGSGEFLTQYGYHPDDSVRWMQYPDDEKLTYFYHAQKAPSSLQTSLESGLYYLSSVSFRAVLFTADMYYNNTSERYILHKLGNNGLQLKQTFFSWSTPNGQGRLPHSLRQITAGTTGTPTSLLDLRYYSGTGTPEYDAVGNIKSILDATNSNQKQCFGYDGLDRLVSAKVGLNNETCSGAVGDGEYPDETYTYDPNTGNLASKTGMGNYTYGNPDHAHAVTATNGKSYGYDANGNQITRLIGSVTYTLSYDAENRLVSVSWAIGSTNHSMTFVFDGDGSRVKSTLDGTTTTFAGTHYEITGSVVTKYYYSGASRIAMRSSIGVRYIFGDHLGSASVTADRYGSSITRQLYKPYGETRSSGSVPTKYQFTGQYAYNGSGEIGLLYYVARFYDAELGRFVSPDTIIPEESHGVQAWDRYAGMNNNPVIFFDRDGHCPWLFLFAITATVGYVTYDTLTTPPKNNPNTPPPPTSADMSEWLIDRIQDTSQSTTVKTLTDMLAGNPIQQVEGLKEWISLVRSKGEWDFKPDIENALLQGQIVLGGKETHSEAVANLFYGFIGSEVGFDSNILQAGAGAFQLWDNRKDRDAWGGLDTMFDEQFDNWWIQFGIYLHGVIQDDLSRLTKEELAEILGVYISQNGDPPQKPAEVDR